MLYVSLYHVLSLSPALLQPQVGLDGEPPHYIRDNFRSGVATACLTAIAGGSPGKLERRGERIYISNVKYRFADVAEAVEG